MKPHSADSMKPVYKEVYEEKEKKKKLEPSAERKKGFRKIRRLIKRKK